MKVGIMSIIGTSVQGYVQNSQDCNTMMIFLGTGDIGQQLKESAAHEELQLCFHERISHDSQTLITIATENLMPSIDLCDRHLDTYTHIQIQRNLEINNNVSLKT